MIEQFINAKVFVHFMLLWYLGFYHNFTFIQLLFITIIINNIKYLLY